MTIKIWEFIAIGIELYALGVISTLVFLMYREARSERKRAERRLKEAEAFEKFINSKEFEHMLGHIAESIEEQLNSTPRVSPIQIRRIK